VTEKKADKPKTADAADPIARLKALEGIYTSDTPGLPTVTMRIKDGKLMIEADGNPTIEGKLSDKDELTGEGLPDGFTVKVTRDKDGKVTGMSISTPMGDAKFTRAPLK
jgi:YD repeat-containing protein